MRYLLAVLSAGVILTVAAGAPAATYYVSTTGKDTNPGSEKEPWATLQHAANTIAPGDTVLVTPGTYAGFHAETSGKAGAVKTLAAQKLGTVLLNAPPAKTKHNGIIELENESGEDAAYWTIEGFEVNGQNGKYRTIDCRHISHVVIRNNAVYGSFMTGVYTSWLNYCLIEKNVSHDNKEHGFYQANTSSHNVYRGNVSHSNAGAGFHLNGDVSQGDKGIVSDTLYERNASHNTGALINCDGVENSVFRNNLSYDDRGKGFALYGGDASIASRNDRVLNNTVVCAAEAFFAVVIKRNQNTNVDPVGNKLFNNILYNKNAAANRGSIVIDAGGFKDFESDYNVVMEHFGVDDAETILTFAQWQAKGYDKHSIQAKLADLFADPDSGDYHLKAGSPAIDAGTALPDVTDDKDGVTRPQGKGYDIGRYEHR